MPAGVVDDLEAIEIEVAQHVYGVAAPRGFRGLRQAPLEFAPVHETGERIMCRLVGHLAVQPTQLRDVMQQYNGAGKLAVIIAQRRCGELDGALLPRGLAQQHRAPTQRMRIVATVDGFPHRVRDQLAIVLVDQREHVLERLAECQRLLHPEHFFRRGIEIDQPAVDIRGDDSLAQRFHREHLQRWLGRRRRRERRRDQRGALAGILLLDLAAGERAQLARGYDFNARDQQRRHAFEFDLRGS